MLCACSNETVASAAATRLLPSSVCLPDSLVCNDSARESSVVPALDVTKTH